MNSLNLPHFPLFCPGWWWDVQLSTKARLVQVLVLLSAELSDELPVMSRTGSGRESVGRVTYLRSIYCRQRDRWRREIPQMIPG